MEPAILIMENLSVDSEVERVAVVLVGREQSRNST